MKRLIGKKNTTRGNFYERDVLMHILCSFLAPDRTGLQLPGAGNVLGGCRELTKTPNQTTNQQTKTQLPVIPDCNLADCHSFFLIFLFVCMLLFVCRLLLFPQMCRRLKFGFAPIVSTLVFPATSE